MKASEYTLLIAQRLTSAFDIGHEWLGVKYDLTAVFRERMEQTALFRDNVMDWSSTTEVVLVTVVDDKVLPSVIASKAKQSRLHQILAELKDVTIASSHPDRHHRQTTVVRVIVGHGWGKDEVTAVKRYRFSRSFRLGFWGWCTAAVVLVDLNNGEVVTNWAGRSRKKYFLPEIV